MNVIEANKALWGKREQTILGEGQKSGSIKRNGDGLSRFHQRQGESVHSGLECVL